MDKTLLWLAGLAVTAIGVVIAVLRKGKPGQWQEGPCRNYDPALDEEEKP